MAARQSLQRHCVHEHSSPEAESGSVFEGLEEEGEGERELPQKQVGSGGAPS